MIETFSQMHPAISGVCNRMACREVCKSMPILSSSNGLKYFTFAASEDHRGSRHLFWLRSDARRSLVGGYLPCMARLGGLGFGFEHWSVSDCNPSNTTLWKILSPNILFLSISKWFIFPTVAPDRNNRSIDDIPIDGRYHWLHLCTTQCDWSKYDQIN